MNRRSVGTGIVGVLAGPLVWLLLLLLVAGDPALGAESQDGNDLHGTPGLSFEEAP